MITTVIIRDTNICIFKKCFLELLSILKKKGAKSENIDFTLLNPIDLCV